MSVRVLIVDARSRRAEALEAALKEAGFDVIMTATEQSDLHDLVEQLKPDAVLIDTALPSRDILEHLSHINHQYPRPMILFSEDTGPDLTKQAVRAGVSAYVVEGVVPSLLRSLIDVAITQFETHHKLKQELTRTRESLEQRRIIDRAKTALMEHYQLSEETAYQQLRTLAMNQRISVHEVSRELLTALPATPKKTSKTKQRNTGQEGESR